jgi:SprB repeat
MLIRLLLSFLHMKSLYYLLSILLSTNASAQALFYVDASAQGLNDGTSWANAFTNLHDGLSTAQAGDQIWVAKATYHPSTNADRNIHFELKSGVKLYGGFAGTESALTQRDWSAHPSIIDGDIGLVGDSTDNSYNLLYMDRPDEATVVDGFIFQNGVGNFDMFIYAPGTCGGAIFMDGKNGTAYPLIANCNFIHNSAVFAGGAVFASSTPGGSVAPRFLNCLFERNICAGGWGGAYYRTGGCSTEQPGDLVNCRFIENEAPGNGGAVFLGDAARSDTMDIINCLFEKNFSKGFGGGIFTGGTPSGTYIRVAGTRFIRNKAKVASGFCHYSEENPINKITFDSCAFDGNTFYIDNPLATRFAAAFEIYSGYYNPGNSVRRLIAIRNCKVENHEGHTMEAAVFHGNIDLLSNTFSNNKVSEFGTLDTIRFYRNIVRNNPGFISLAGNPNKNTTFIINNLFEGNHATNGMFRSYKSSIVAGNAFINNNVVEANSSGSGSGGDPWIVQNNIFWGNTYILQPDNLTWRIPWGNVPSVFSNNLFDFPSCDSLPSAFICESGNRFSADPPFVDLANGDYRLQPCSPAYNAGINLIYQQLSIATDFLGNPRIVDGVVDIGPFEIADFVQLTPPTIHPSCESFANGSVSFHLANGCPPYQFQWSGSNGMGTDTVGLLPGNYNFSITDSQGRMLIADLAVGTALIPVVEAAIMDASCQNCSNGAITLTIVDGIAPYKFQWNNDSISMNLSGVLPGQYTLTITDASGCDLVLNFVVSFSLGAIEQKAPGQCSLVPNPAENTVTLKSMLPASILEIYDVLGRIVKRQELGIGTSINVWQANISLDGLVNGQYLIVLRNADGQLLTREKLIKQE